MGHAEQINSKAGTLFLVVGPSGVGKDSLIDGAKRVLADNANYIFPSRYLTRPQGAGGEDHIEISTEDFQRAKEAGAFAFYWDAHDLSYGVPANIKDALDQGQHVVVNVSRGILDQARSRFSKVRIISMSAPSAVLKSRLEARRRESPDDIAERLARAAAYQVTGPDVIELVNDSSLEEASAKFVGILKADI